MYAYAQRVKFGIKHGLRVYSSLRSIVSSTPNPFVSLTRIDFSIPGGVEAAALRLTIHDATGRLVHNLLDGTRPLGIHSVAWDGTDQEGAALPGGVYFARLSVGDQNRTQRVLLVR